MAEASSADTYSANTHPAGTSVPGAPLADTAPADAKLTDPARVGTALDNTAPADPALATSEGSSRHTAARQRLVVLACLLAVLGMLCWFQARSLATAKDTTQTALAQLAQMQTDASRIQTLRAEPQSAASRTRANEELLAQVERALAAARIERERWHDSIPQPATQLPGSDYKRLTTLLYFQALTLQQLAAFCHHLEQSDPTLSVTAVNLTNRAPDTADYDIDLAVSYRVYAPRTR